MLKALGYGEGKIMGKYLFYSGSAAFTGCVAGYFLGIHLFPLVIWQAYGMMYKFGEIVYASDWITAVFCLAAALLCSMGTTWVSCRHELKEVAAELMRPKSPKAGKRVFLEWVPFVWNRLKFLHKVSVRNIVRYKRRFFMMVIGISGCTALLLTGFGIRDSVTTIADRQFEEVQTYQLGITLKDGVAEDNTASTAEIAGIIEVGGLNRLLFCRKQAHSHGKLRSGRSWQQGQGEQEQRSASRRVCNSDPSFVCGGDFSGDGEPQAVVSFFFIRGFPGGAGSKGWAVRRRPAAAPVEPFENLFPFLWRNAISVIFYTDCNFPFMFAFREKKTDFTSRRRVGKGVGDQDVTHLPNSERIAFTQRDLVFWKRYGKPVRTLRGKHPETFISLQKKSLQVCFFHLKGKSVAVGP